MAAKFSRIPLTIPSQQHTHTHTHANPTSPQSYTRYLEIVFAAAGLSLSISGALTTWVKASLTASAPALGLSLTQNLAVGPLASNTGNGLTYSNQSAQLTAGASLLLIGFIVGVFHLVNAILLARGFTGTTLVSKPIATLAFVCTLIGTIVSGAVSLEGCAHLFSRCLPHFACTHIV